MAVTDVTPTGTVNSCVVPVAANEQEAVVPSSGQLLDGGAAVRYVCCSSAVRELIALVSAASTVVRDADESAAEGDNATGALVANGDADGVADVRAGPRATAVEDVVAMSTTTTVATLSAGPSNRPTRRRTPVAARCRGCGFDLVLERR
ncbi:hypothetical protein GIS00_24620 [Nakamurella sp. YIM 132087]|uniref:Uncharacterized protein n=1 Tax=Nakamurella alba TaxID=2665158 RepID=A0A7K1FSJ7_9ACTN|nr:hypothetical protein [Nakamurella alba]MTD17125.1 hypothetical protein [Nakamurella alba]